LYLKHLFGFLINILENSPLVVVLYYLFWLIVIAFAIPKMELFDEADLSKLDPCERPDVECDDKTKS
jgi:hypothetical protein